MARGHGAPSPTARFQSSHRMLSFVGMLEACGRGAMGQEGVTPPPTGPSACAGDDGHQGRPGHRRADATAEGHRAAPPPRNPRGRWDEGTEADPGTPRARGRGGHTASGGAWWRHQPRYPPSRTDTSAGGGAAGVGVIWWGGVAYRTGAGLCCCWRGVRTGVPGAPQEGGGLGGADAAVGADRPHHAAEGRGRWEEGRSRPGRWPQRR